MKKEGENYALVRIILSICLALLIIKERLISNKFKSVKKGINNYISHEENINEVKIKFNNSYLMSKYNSCISGSNSNLFKDDFNIIIKLKLTLMKIVAKAKIKFIKYKKMLENLTNPYGLNVYNYLFIKYFVSIFVFIMFAYRTHKISISLVYATIIYLIPNFYIYRFKKNESLVLINDLTSMVNTLVLYLSSSTPFYISLKNSIEVIKYTRLKEEMKNFVDDYYMYNFNILKAIDNIERKINSYEFNMFLNILYEGEKDGNIIESLTSFSKSLEMAHFKTLKVNEGKRTVFVIAACAMSVVNIAMVCIYPMISELTSSFSNIFN